MKENRDEIKNLPGPVFLMSILIGLIFTGFIVLDQTGLNSLMYFSYAVLCEGSKLCNNDCFDLL